MSSPELRELLAKTHVSEKVKGIDIKDDFFRACEELKLGEVVFTDGFRLHDAMGAVQLMDPKMDIGMERYIRKSGVEQLKSLEYFDTVNDREVLTIIDATLSCFVSYLEGGNVANTLYSNVLLSEPYSFDHSILSTLAQIFSFLVPIIRTVIHNVMVFEEEDFNISIPYVVPTEGVVTDCLDKMKEIEESLSKQNTNTEVSNAIASRFQWIRLLVEFLTSVIPLRTKDESNANVFKPCLDTAATIAQNMKNISATFIETYKLGLEAPVSFEEDGKFEWLGVFQPDYNKQYLTGSFPRRTIIQSRNYSMAFLNSLSCRLYRIADESDEAASDFSKLLKFFKDFSMDNSCVFTRSVLQFTMFPHDELVLGSTSLLTLIDTSVRKVIRHVVLEEGSPANNDEECRNIYADFLDEITKATLTMVANFGMNLARQREKLAASIEDLIVTQGLAEHLDRRCNMLMSGCEIEGHPQHPLLGFVFNHLVNIIHYHMELSFKLDLFAPYEYAHYYWYFGEILCRWHLNSVERILEVTYYDYKVEIEKNASTKNKKKNARRVKIEEDIKQRIEHYHDQKIKLIGEGALATGIFKATIGLTKWGKIKVPRWEPNTDRLHFEHRMAPFANLGPPLHLNYYQYLNVSKYCENLQNDPKDMFKQAIESFELAKTHFHRLIERSEMIREAESLEMLCKNNIVVLRLLLSGKMDNKKADWIMSEDSCFPILRLS